jgi:hypothetical protein
MECTLPIYIANAPRPKILWHGPGRRLEHRRDQDPGIMILILRIQPAGEFLPCHPVIYFCAGRSAHSSGYAPRTRCAPATSSVASELCLPCPTSCAWLYGGPICAKNLSRSAQASVHEAIRLGEFFDFRVRLTWRIGLRPCPTRQPDRTARGTNLPHPMHRNNSERELRDEMLHSFDASGLRKHLYS